MLKCLEKIRIPDKKSSLSRQIINTVIIAAFGFSAGIFSKVLDSTPSNHQPFIFQTLDLRNFFSRFAVWILLAVIISVFSSTPVRAGINVFCFYSAMLAGYYGYTVLVCGFYPRSYMLIWIIITAISPILAFICWYARGSGPAALIISAGITAVLFSLAFSFGMFYFDCLYVTEAAVWIIGIAVLYKSPAQLAKMSAMSAVFVIAAKLALTFIF